MRPIRPLFIFAALFCVISIASPLRLAAAEDIPKLFDPKVTTLENGLEVVVLEDHRAPVVTHMVWYRVGAADEKPLKSGIAHFLEHLMFKGTKNLEPGEFSEIVAENGGQENAFTSQDYTAYFQNVSADKLPLFMEMEADRMNNLVLTDDIVAPELKVVLEERSQRTDNNPAALFGEQFTATQFLAHPYGTPVIGWRHEIENLTTQDALDWYNTYYTPNNAILIVAGDVKAEEVFELAEKYYGPIPARDIPERERAQEPPQLAKRTIEMSDKRVREPSWRQSYLAPSARSEDQANLRALEVLSQILGGGVTSRLYADLVVDQKIATNAGAYYSSGSYDKSTFVVYGSPTSDHTLDEVEASVQAIIQDVIKNGVTEKELNRAKRKLLADAIYARDSIRGAANIFGGALASGETIENIVNWPQHISEVTAEQVQEAARNVFDERQSVVGRLTPEDVKS
ncbi:pitrilysin family protein [uncultured Sneathiella sp.]|jgi:zinc protease|uniref:M16 family metallopeptidase n=1 Tax=uncultured Sneathiella sp. TaxID=879315 RepID=UPI0030D8D6E3|tara:strand:+ start:1493 stop:2860 length:1368 start_codon:yes stop_codon:yes gene_type:complete